MHDVGPFSQPDQAGGYVRGIGGTDSTRGEEKVLLFLVLPCARSAIEALGIETGDGEPALHVWRNLGMRSDAGRFGGEGEGLDGT